MRKITVVAQAPYPVPLPNGRHLLPGEIAKDIDADAIESELAIGFLREVAKLPAEEKTPTRTPGTKSREDNKDDQ